MIISKNIKIRALVLAAALIGGIVIGAVTKEISHHVVSYRTPGDTGVCAASVNERVMDSIGTAIDETKEAK